MQLQQWVPVARGAQSEVSSCRLFRKTFVGCAVAWSSRTSQCADPHLAFQREVRALEALRASNAPFPQIVARNDETPWLVLSDCGSPLTSSAVPPQWKAQLLDIVDAMRITNIYHNDVHPDNMTVSADGRLHLIDFGWASFGSPSFPEMNILPEDVHNALVIDDVFDSIFKRAKGVFGETAQRRVAVIERMHARHSSGTKRKRK